MDSIKRLKTRVGTSTPPRLAKVPIFQQPSPSDEGGTTVTNTTYSVAVRTSAVENAETAAFVFVQVFGWQFIVVEEYTLNVAIARATTLPIHIDCGQSNGGDGSPTIIW